MDPTRRTPFRILCRCLTGALGQPLVPSDLPANSTEWEEVLRLSSAHLVIPQLRWALREQGLFADVPADAADYLEAVYALNLERNSECEDQLAQLIPMLNSIGVTPVLLKGCAAIVGNLYPTSGERMISDIDILIPTAKLPEILDRLAAVGCKPRVSVGMAVPETAGYEKKDHHYPPVISPSWRCRIELHLHPVWLSAVSFLPSDEMFREAVPLSWRGGSCLLPSPGNFLAHNLIHAFLMNVKGGFERVSLRQLFEFALASQAYGGLVDWHAMRARFDDHGRPDVLPQYLALASSCFDFEVPSAIAVTRQDRQRIQYHLKRVEFPNRRMELGINILRQGKRLANPLRNPRKLGMLLTLDFYSRLLKSLRS